MANCSFRCCGPGHKLCDPTPARGDYEDRYEELEEAIDERYETN